jgi:ribonuclease P protein component
LTDAGRPRRFGPDDRVRRKREFDEAYARGVRIPSRYFTFIAHPSGQNRTRLGLTLSRKVGGAVVRNSVRRRLREVFRRNRNDRWPRADVVLQVHPVAARASYADLEAAFLQAMLRYETRHEIRK